MAEPATHHSNAAVAEHAHEPIDSWVYIRVAIILAIVTAVEVGASFLTRIGVPQWLEAAVLLVLGTVKAAYVVLIFMHLKFDSRWFSWLFMAGTVIAAFLMITFLLLFSYKAGLAG